MSNLGNSTSKEIDALILGNIYSYLALNSNKKENSNDYYFQLLASEYLAVEINWN